MNIPLLALYHQNKKMIFLFVLNGVITAFIYFSLFALIWHMLQINRIISVTIAYIVAASFHFFVNRTVIFKSKNPQIMLQMLKYVALFIINYLITLFILELSMLFISSPYFGLILATGVTAITGFLISRYWVFKTAGLH